MDQAAFARVAASFAAFHQHFAPLFGRRETRRRSEQSLRGLLVEQTDRRNAENLAEAVAVYRDGELVAELGEDDVLDGGAVLPEFRLPVAEIFAEL